jgi:hypothetical protein
MLRSFSCLGLFVLIAAVAPAQVIFHEDFSDNSAGWTLGTEWGIGAATASAGHTYGGPDPATDADGKAGGGIAGVVIGGNASTAGLHGFFFLESPVIDCTGSTNLKLEYDRWLNSDYTPYMQNRVDVWDGGTWQNVFLTGGSPGVQDASWAHLSHNITGFSNPRLRVRFGFNVGNTGVFTVSSWNLDNVRISNGEYFFDRFNNNLAGWTLDTEWGIGDATAGGGGSGCGGIGDPGTDGDGIAAGGLAGVIIGGNATTGLHPFYFLTSPVINTAGSNLLRLQFNRWLNSDYPGFMQSIVQVWDGASWNTLFANSAGQCITEGAWSTQLYDISPYSNPALQVRFGHTVGSAGAYSMSQWNLDNVSIHDPAGTCTLQLSAYAGPGSIRISAHCLGIGVPPGTQLFNCITLNPGFGWFFGINPSLSLEVIPQYTSGALPFVGYSNVDGDVSWDLPAGVPPGIPVYAVTVALNPGGVPVAVSPPVFYVTP